MTLLGDPFAGLVIAGLSLGVVGGVGVGWGSVCLAAALRRPGLRWLTRQLSVAIGKVTTRSSGAGGRRPMRSRRIEDKTVPDPR